MLTKDQKLNVSLSTLVSLIAVGTTGWLFVKPAMTKAVAAELGDEITATVQREVMPLKDGFEVIIQQQILSLRKQIAQLERVRAANPVEWSAQQANDLVDLRAQLEAQEQALGALRRSR